MRVAFDTHTLVYWTSMPERLSPAQAHAVSAISPENPAIVADISLWEIAMLHDAGRLALHLPVRDWLTRAVAPPLVRIAEISPNIAGEVSELSGWAHRDPADRLIVATARVYGANLLSNDAAIRESGLVSVV